MYVSQLKITIILFFICNSAFSFSELRERWVSGYKFELYSQFRNMAKIEGTPGIFEVIGEVFYLDSKFNTLKDCLIFKTKTKESAGEFKVLSSSGLDCKKRVLDDSLIHLKEIYNFSIEWDRPLRKLTFLIDTKSYDYKFFNIDNRSGLKVSLSKDSSGKVLSAGSVCFDVGDDCSEVVNTDCSLCEFGSYDVVASNCQLKTRKYCRSSKQQTFVLCGKKGMPACLRGWQASGFKLDYCIPDSPIGFCEKPLRVFCTNEELICN